MNHNEQEDLKSLTHSSMGWTSQNVEDNFLIRQAASNRKKKITQFKSCMPQNIFCSWTTCLFLEVTAWKDWKFPADEFWYTIKTVKSVNIQIKLII